MATAIIKTVGATSRQYADMQLFEDAIPADITSTDESWTGECYNDAEFTVSVNFAGITTDATRFVKLTTAADQSFIDHADAATNPQAYDQSKGVGLFRSSAHDRGITNRINNLILENLQVKVDSTAVCIGNVGFTASEIYRNLICHRTSSSGAAECIELFGSGSSITNTITITNSTTGNGFDIQYGSQAYNCTAISPNNVTNTGIGFKTKYSNNVAKNCASFGFGTDYDASGWDTGASSHNASDSTGNPGSNSQDSLTFADQFVDDTNDFRVKAGSSLIANGTRDATNTNDLDIVGNKRSIESADQANPTIGSWEYAIEVTKSVGSNARQYIDMQVWEDAIPADLTNENERWTGECYKDTEFTTNTSFAGTTTDATRSVKLTTAVDQSFMDHSDVLTNPQTYDETKGVALYITNSYGRVINVATENVTIENIQLRRGNAGGANSCIDQQAAGDNLVIRNLIMLQDDLSANYVVRFEGDALAVNCLAIVTPADNVIGFSCGGNNNRIRNCTAVVPSDVVNTGGRGFNVSNYLTNNTVVNCVSLGFPEGFSTANWDTGSDYNASDDQSGPGANSVDDLDYDDQFENNTLASMDFRVKAGSGLIDNGTRDETNTNDLDIIGQARSLTTPTIGQWEFIASGLATTSLVIRQRQLIQFDGSTTSTNYYTLGTSAPRTAGRHTWRYQSSAAVIQVETVTPPVITGILRQITNAYYRINR